MCPPETRVTVQYEVGLAHNEHGKEILHVKSSTVSHDVPYGDHFSVDEKIEMLREGDGVLVTKSWSADWVKRSFLKSMIDTCQWFWYDFHFLMIFGVLLYVLFRVGLHLHNPTETDWKLNIRLIFFPQGLELMIL